MIGSNQKVSVVNKRAIISEVAQSASVSKKQAQAAVDAVVYSIATSPKQSDIVRIAGIGVFESKSVKGAITSGRMAGTGRFKMSGSVSKMGKTARGIHSKQHVSSGHFAIGSGGTSHGFGKSLSKARQVFISFSSETNKRPSANKSDAFVQNAVKLAKRF